MISDLQQASKHRFQEDSAEREIHGTAYKDKDNYSIAKLSSRRCIVVNVERGARQ